MSPVVTNEMLCCILTWVVFTISAKDLHWRDLEKKQTGQNYLNLLDGMFWNKPDLFGNLIRLKISVKCGLLYIMTDGETTY